MNTHHLCRSLMLLSVVTLMLRGDDRLNAEEAKKLFRAGAYAMDITPTKFPI